MKIISKFLLAIYFMTAVAFAEEGCFNKSSGTYLRIGSAYNSLICSKLPNGKYIWVEANTFDMGGGCWAIDKYPENAILIHNNDYLQCVLKDGFYQWIPYRIQDK